MTLTTPISSYTSQDLRRYVRPPGREEDLPGGQVWGVRWLPGGEAPAAAGIDGSSRTTGVTYTRGAVVRSGRGARRVMSKRGPWCLRDTCSARAAKAAARARRWRRGSGGGRCACQQSATARARVEGGALRLRVRIATSRVRARRTPGAALSPMPSRIASAPASWAGPNGSPKASAPAAAPTSGSRFRNAPALAGDVRDCPKANSANGASVPSVASAASASTGPAPAGAAGRPSSAAFGRGGQRAGEHLHGRHGDRVAARAAARTGRPRTWPTASRRPARARRPAGEARAAAAAGHDPDAASASAKPAPRAGWSRPRR